MSDELTQAPRVDGEFWVFPDGQRLARVRGAEAMPEAAEDTPAEDAAPVENGTPAEPEAGGEVNWEKRFKDLQPELTKAQQENARLRAIEEGLRNPERAAEVLQQYGFSVEDDEVPDPDDEEQDPLTTLEQRLVAQEERDRQRAEQEGVSRFNADLDKLASGKGATLSQRERTAIYLETMQNGADPDALQKAFNGLMEERVAYDKQVIDRYIKSKRNAPHVAPGGTGATDDVLPDDATHAQRVEWMTQRYALGEQQ